jgi:hypothetical protein
MRTTTMKHTAVALAAAALYAAVAPLAAFAAAPPAAGAAQPATPEPLDVLRDRPDQPAPAAALGPAFESRAAGIAFRPPAGCREIHRGNPDDIVEFVNDAKSWSLKVTRSTLSRPVPLTEYFDNGRKQPGVLEMTADNLKRDNPTAEIVRQDTIDLGANKVGMLASRNTIGNQRRLFQQAIVQMTDQQYYVLLFNSPAAPRGAATDADHPDPKEKEAVETFTNILDTVKLLDRSSIKEDQDQRLIRTRTFLVNLTDNHVKRALVAEQWLRLIQNGKDIGYTYVVEEPYKQGGNDGVRIGVRSRTTPAKGVQVDAETWMFSTVDRRHETWTNLAKFGDGANTKDYSSEVGYSDVEVSHVVDRNAPPNQKNPPIVISENHTLTVDRSTKSSNKKPITRPVPLWYLPQALSHLLPRILPIDAPRAYMFATYVSDQGEIMSRYVDIGRPVDVTLAPGAPTLHAIPIKDRIGLEGSVTTHYVSADGKYLGSVNDDSKITILPSDRETILKLWSNANLTRPAEPANNGAGGASDNRNSATAR